MATFSAKEAAARAKHPDYDAVVRNPMLPINDVILDAVMDMDIGPEVVFHLGKNPGKCAEIASMSPARAGRELAKIEAQLSVPPSKKTTEAPPPPRKVKSGGKSKKDPEDMSTAEWMEWRANQLRQ